VWLICECRRCHRYVVVTDYSLLRCAVNKNGEGAIHLAAYRDHLVIVKYLISEAGVDKNVRGEVI